MGLTVCCGLALLVAGVLVWPHLYTDNSTTEMMTSSNSIRLTESKERLLLEFQDLELDRQGERVGVEEYSRMRAGLEGELAQVLTALEDLPDAGSRSGTKVG